MPRPVFYVDFNAMIDDRTVVLSRNDTKVDKMGITVQLYEGMMISVYMDDVDVHGNIDDLVADGTVILNLQKDWSSSVKWCCRIDDNGIRRRSGAAA